MTEFPGESIAALVSKRVGGEQVEFSKQAAGPLENAQYYFATYGTPASNSASQSITLNGSSPWWAARLVAPPAGAVHIVHGRTAASQEPPMLEDMPQAFLNVVRIESEAPAFNVYDRGRMTFNDPRLGLDFGRGVVVASGAVAAPVRTVAIESVGIRRFSVPYETFDLDWLAPDQATIDTATTPVDDAEWDDEEPGPTWISLADVSYRGGGVMGRRRGPTVGPAGD